MERIILTNQPPPPAVLDPLPNPASVPSFDEGGVLPMLLNADREADREVGRAGTASPSTLTDPEPSTVRDPQADLTPTLAPDRTPAPSTARRVSDERIDLLHGGYQENLRGVVLDPEQARIGDISKATVTHHPSLEEVVITIERRRADASFEPKEQQFESIQVKLKVRPHETDVPGERERDQVRVVAAVTDVLRGLIKDSRAPEAVEREVPNWGSLVGKLQCLTVGQDINGVQEIRENSICEITARNAVLDLTPPPGSSVNLDGLALVNCDNVKILATRTDQQREAGTFGVQLPHLLISGARNSLSISGINCEMLEIDGKLENMKLLALNECNLVGARVAGPCEVADLTITNSNFGNNVDFSALSVTKPPQTEVEFRARFCGCVFAQVESVKFHTSWGFADHQAALEKVPDEQVLASMMRPSDGVQMHDRIVFSSQYEAKNQSGPDANGRSVWRIDLAGEQHLLITTQVGPAGSVVAAISYLEEAGKRPKELWVCPAQPENGNDIPPSELVDDLKRFFRSAQQRRALSGLTDPTARLSDLVNDDELEKLAQNTFAKSV